MSNVTYRIHMTSTACTRQLPGHAADDVKYVTIATFVFSVIRFPLAFLLHSHQETTSLPSFSRWSGSPWLSCSIHIRRQRLAKMAQIPSCYPTNGQSTHGNSEHWPNYQTFSIFPSFFHSSPSDSSVNDGA